MITYNIYYYDSTVQDSQIDIASTNLINFEDLSSLLEPNLNFCGTRNKYISITRIKIVDEILGRLVGG